MGKRGPDYNVIQNVFNLCQCKIKFTFRDNIIITQYFSVYFMQGYYELEALVASVTLLKYKFYLDGVSTSHVKWRKHSNGLKWGVSAGLENIHIIVGKPYFFSSMTWDYYLGKLRVNLLGAFILTPMYDYTIANTVLSDATSTVL